MSSALDDYKELVDGLVEIRPSISVNCVREGRPWPDTPENEGINEFLTTLSEPQREALAKLLQQERDGGIHDVLVYLNDSIYLDGYRFSRNGRELPTNPFGTKLYYDWVCRLAGQDWPPPVESDAPPPDLNSGSLEAYEFRAPEGAIEN